MPSRFPIWDAPVRLFHWALAVLVVFSFVTGELGGSNWMPWHLKSGYCILALLIFRLAWGVVGGHAARFANFVRGPRVALEYARATLARRHQERAGHNPLGGWSVISMLVLLLLQASTGLFSNDEISTEGPLTGLVSDAMVGRLTTIHKWNVWLIVGAVALHVAVVATYQWALKVNLLGPMFHGGTMPGNLPTRRGSIVLAAAILAIASAAVYYLVVILPRSP